MDKQVRNEEIRRLKEKGWTVYKLAEKFGLSYQRISTISPGITRPQRKARNESMRELRKEGWMFEAIANKFGVAVNTAWQATQDIKLEVDPMIEVRKQTMIELRKNGWFLKDIGNLFGISEAAVSYHIGVTGQVYFAEERWHMPVSLLDRWRKRVIFSAEENCWDWAGTKMTSGYGYLTMGGGRKQGAHRISWMLHNGPIPKNIFVLHKCDNKLCMNPGHLWLGTHDDNMADMCAKGRQSKPGKLSENEVREVRKRFADGETQVDLGKEYGVSFSAISQMITHRTYKWVDQPT